MDQHKQPATIWSAGLFYVLFLLFFFDIRILSRVVFFNTTTANILVFALTGFFVFWLIGALLAQGLKKHEAFFGFLFVFSAARLSVTGVSYTVIAQLFGGYIGVIATLVILRNQESPRILVWGFGLGMLIHAFVIWEPTGILRQLALSNTAYWGAFEDDIYSFAVQRTIGLWNAPGYLAGFCAVCSGIFSILYTTERKIRWLLILLVALMGGIATGNRSFLLIMLLVPLLIGAKMKKTAQNIMLIGLLTLAGCVAVLWYFKKSGYLDLTKSRFESITLQRDTETRLTGDAGAISGLQIFSRHILLGAYAWDELSNSEIVRDEISAVRPHTAIVQILASRGIVVGGGIIFLEVVAVIGYLRVRRRTDIPIQHRNMYDAFFAGFVFGNMVALVEPILEFYPILVCIGIGVRAYYLTAPRSIACTQPRMTAIGSRLAFRK